ncbi:hypothetical protein CB1_001010023 [Camelus ferus]|nr:hypothetical protein CB1_001010023 [Camelus ferus]
MRALQGAAEHLIQTGWRVWYLGLCKALALLQAAWIAFSRPVPASCGQLLTQLLLCGSLTVAAAVFLSLGLVPPARCLFALSVPTLGTEQGRRLLLSWSTATLAVAVVPNVLANMHAAGQVLRCVTEGSLESLLNTTHQLHMASRALGPDSQVGGQGLMLQAQDNGSAFQLHMLRVTQQVLEDFSGLESLAQGAALWSQRLVTGLLMLGLLVDSAWYLHRYLTDLRFDNIYATRQLAQQLAEVGATHLVSSPPAWLLWAARPRLSQGELLSCLLRLGLLTLLLVSTAVTVATDHVAFLLAQAAVDWAQKLPAVPITLTVKYDLGAVTLTLVPLVCAVGMAGNAMVVLVVVWSRHMVTPTNCYLYVGINASTGSITAFTVERYLAICRPLRAQALCTVPRAKRIAASVWLGTGAYCMLWVFLADTRETSYADGVQVQCGYRVLRSLYLPVYFLDFALFYALPLGLATVFYELIARVLFAGPLPPGDPGRWGSGHQGGPTGQERFSSRGIRGALNSRKQVTKMLVVVVVLFALLWLPYRTLVVVNSFLSPPYLNLGFLLFCCLCIYLNSAINPIVYALMSQRFREAFHGLFQCRLTQPKLPTQEATLVYCPVIKDYSQHRLRSWKEPGSLMSRQGGDPGTSG